MPRRAYHSETRLIRQIANDPFVGWVYTKHAVEEMKADSVTRLDVTRVLKTGYVDRVETSRTEPTWNVRGRDVDGRMLEVVTVVYANQLKIKVITVWQDKRAK